MTRPKYEVGERVIAQHATSGTERPGVVVGTISGSIVSHVWGYESQYLVRFDGSGGLVGPCVVLRAEGEREAVSPASETGS